MLRIAMQVYVVKHKEFLQCEVICKSLKVVWKGLKYGVGKDQYVTQNVVEVVVVFTFSLFTKR
jgi:diacylglycerol kinase